MVSPPARAPGREIISVMSRPRQPADEAAPLLAAVLLFYLGCLLMFRRLSALLGPARGTAAPEDVEEDGEVRKLQRTGQIILDNKELIREVFAVDSTRVGGADEGHRVSCKISEIVEARYEKERRRSQRPAEAEKTPPVPPKRLAPPPPATTTPEDGSAVRKSPSETRTGTIGSHGKKRQAPKPPPAEPIKPPEQLPKLEVETEAERQRSHAATTSSEIISEVDKVKGPIEQAALTLEPSQAEDQTEKLLKISSEIKLAIAEFREKAEGSCQSANKADRRGQGQGFIPPGAVDKCVSSGQVGEEATAQDKPVVRVENASTKEEKAAQQVDNKDVTVLTNKEIVDVKAETVSCEVTAAEKPAAEKKTEIVPVEISNAGDADIVECPLLHAALTLTPSETKTAVGSVDSNLTQVRAVQSEYAITTESLKTTIDAGKTSPEVSKSTAKSVKSASENLPVDRAKELQEKERLLAKTISLSPKKEKALVENAKLLLEAEKSLSETTKSVPVLKPLVLENSQPEIVLIDDSSRPEPQKSIHEEVRTSEEPPPEPNSGEPPADILEPPTEKINCSSQAESQLEITSNLESSAENPPELSTIEPVVENIKPSTEIINCNPQDENPLIVANNIEPPSETNISEPIAENPLTDTKNSEPPAEHPTTDAINSESQLENAPANTNNTEPAAVSPLNSDIPTENPTTKAINSEALAENTPPPTEKPRAEAVVSVDAVDVAKSPQETIEIRTDTKIEPGSLTAAAENSKSEGKREIAEIEAVNCGKPAAEPVTGPLNEAPTQNLESRPAEGDNPTEGKPQAIESAQVQVQEAKDEGVTSDINNAIVEQPAPTERDIKVDSDCAVAAVKLEEKAAESIVSASVEIKSSAASERIEAASETQVLQQPELEAPAKSEDPKPNNITDTNVENNSQVVDTEEKEEIERPKHIEEAASAVQAKEAEIAKVEGYPEKAVIQVPQIPKSQTECVQPKGEQEGTKSEALPKEEKDAPKEGEKPIESQISKPVEAHLNGGSNAVDEGDEEDHLMKKIESFLVTENNNDDEDEVSMSEAAVKLEPRHGIKVKRVSSVKRSSKLDTCEAQGDGGKNADAASCGIQSGKVNSNADKKIKTDDATKLAAGKQPTQPAPKIGFGVLRPRPKSGGLFTSDPQPRPKSDELSEVFNKIVLRKAAEEKRKSEQGALKSKSESKVSRVGSRKTKEKKAETNGVKGKTRETSPLKNGQEKPKLKSRETSPLKESKAKAAAEPAAESRPNSEIAEEKSNAGQVQAESSGAEGDQLAPAVADAVRPDLCAASSACEPQKTNSSPINIKAGTETKRDDAPSAVAGRSPRSSRSPAKNVSKGSSAEPKTAANEAIRTEESTVGGKLVPGQKLDKDAQSSSSSSQKETEKQPESVCDRVAKRLESIRAEKEQPKPVFFRSGVLGQLEAQRDEKLQDHVCSLQARCRGFLARRRFEKRKVQEVAVRCVQRNVRRFLKVRDWPWWRLLVRVAPLLNVHRAEEELRKQTEELEGLKMRLDKSEAEKLRLKQHNERLEARMNELSVALAEEQSAAHLAAERLENESAERSRLQHELQNAQPIVVSVQEKQSSLREASQRLEMEILMCRATDDSSHTSGDDDDAGYEHLKQRLDRAVKEAAALRRQLQQQQEAHEDQLMALRKATEKRVADALEEVEEQRQVVAQMKRKAQRVTGEHNDTRLMLEEQSARNAILEKRQKKFDSEMHQLQESLRLEKSAKEKALRERDLMAAEKTSAEQNLAACRLELEMRDEKVASLGRELEELAFGGAAEEEVAALRKAKHTLERRVKEQEEELDELAGQVGLLEAAKVRLEMSLEQQRKESKREASQRDDELEEIRGNAQKKVRALESQLETEHEERTRLLRDKHDLERRLAEAAESARGRAPEDEQTIQRLRRELRHAKALLRDAHGLLERQRDETGGRGQLRALRHQLEDAEAARAVAMKARQTAEAEARELQAVLEEERRGRALAEDRAAAAVRAKTEAAGQLEENEEELAEVMKKYKAAVTQISVEQAATTELAVTAAALEAERNSLREQVAEMSARLEAAEGDTTTGLTARRLETKIRELESRLELEATTRARAETQCGRFREQADKMAAEAEAARLREATANDAARRSARLLREAREREANVSAKEAEAIRKRKEIELRVETVEAEAAQARADLRLALLRIEDLQAAMAGDSEDLGSESSGSIESLLDSVGESQEFLDFACRSPEGQSDPGDGVGHLTDSKDESHA